MPLEAGHSTWSNIFSCQNCEFGDIDGGGGFKHRPRALNLPFSLFLALRYLKPKRTFVSVITVLSVLGVALGIACLIVVIAVMTGFDRELRSRIIGFEPHLTVSVGGTLNDWEPLQQRIEKEYPGVAAAPYVMGPVLLQFEGEFISATMRGVQPKGELKLVDLEKFVTIGRYELDSEKCIMGKALAGVLGVNVGDKIQLHGPGNLKKVVNELQRMEKEDPGAKSLKQIKEMVRPEEVEVVGLFETGRYEYDSNFVVVQLAVAQAMYDFEDTVHGLALRTPNADTAEKFKPQLAAALGPEYHVTSWVDNNRERLDAVAHERVLMMFVLMMIVVVAAFSISNTLITVIVQKKREIGLLKALGAPSSRLVGIFLGQGFIVGVLGNVAGLLLGWGVLSWRNEIRNWLIHAFNVDIFNASIYSLSGIPSSIAGQDVVLICAMSMGICLLAAYSPARFAAKLDPVKALREE